MTIKSFAVLYLGRSNQVKLRKGSEMTEHRMGDSWREKIRGFTLIEILIASLIFVTVAVMAVAAFASAKKSNDQSSDMRVINECNHQIGDLLRAKVQGADIEKRIYGLIKTDTDTYKLEKPSSLRDGKNYTGLAVFESSNQFTPIFKQDGAYFYTDNPIEMNPDPIFAYNFTPVRLGSQDCQTYVSQSVPGAAIVKDKPFLVKQINYFTVSGVPGDEQDKIYSINLRDAIYRARDTQMVIEDEQGSHEKGIYSILDINVVNSVRPL